VDFQGYLIHERYLLGPPIGEGGAATVYCAEDRRLGRTVAVKVLRPELKANRTLVARFEREAQSAARLDHPHIVPVYDFGEVADTYFLVMQYVTGGDLRARLHADEPLPLVDAVRLGAEIAEGLGAAHTRGIVHRDVKPANVLLTEDGHAKVADFGIAKMLDVSTLATGTGFLGTPHYLAPEQATGEGVTPATDVYSLGMVLFEIVAGRRAFEGESFVQVIMQHLSATPPRLDEVRPDVPPALAAAVTRAVEKKPAARFADGAAMARALRTVLASLDAREGARPLDDVASERPPAATLAAPPAALAVEAAVPTRPVVAAPVPVATATPPPVDAVNGWPVVRFPERESLPSQASGSAATSEGEPPRAVPAAGETISSAFESERPDWATAPERSAREVPGPRRWQSARPAQASSRLVTPLVLAAMLGVALVGLLASRALWGDRTTGDAAAAVATPATAPAGEDANAVLPPAGAPAGGAGNGGAGGGPDATTAAAVATPTDSGATGGTAPTAVTAEAPAPAAAAGAAAPTVAGAAAPARGQVVIDDDAFDGGFSAPRQYRGRTARWLYGALSPHGQMTARFRLDAPPGAGQLTIAGVDSENGPQTPIEILVNGTSIYQGGNPLPKDTWRGSVAPWGEATVPIPAGVLRAGENTLTFKNLVPVNNYNAPPYFMLDRAVVTYGQ
jgi:serine/threonine-protein kinase